MFAECVVNLIRSEILDSFFHFRIKLHCSASNERVDSESAELRILGSHDFLTLEKSLTGIVKFFLGHSQRQKFFQFFMDPRDDLSRLAGL